VKKTDTSKLQNYKFEGLEEVLPRFRSTSVVVLSGGRKGGRSNNRKAHRPDIRRSSRWVKMYMEV